MKLNLEAKTKEQELVKQYLERNASAELARKINNGASFVKHGVTLLNKKTLDSFMKFAADEARKLASKGAQSACVEDSVVYGWAIHYFEEESIEGTLYNQDGTEYKPAPVHTAKVTSTPTTVVKSKPKEPTLFDFMQKDEAEDFMPGEDEQQEIIEELHREDEVKQKAAEPAPFYKVYLEIARKYAGYIVAYRLGDFYEVLGDGAEKIANSLDLTLTSKNVGIENRIAMVGFPYHAASVYFNKIMGKGFKLAVIDTDGLHLMEDDNVDLETGEIYEDLTEEEMREFDGDILEPEELVETENTALDDGIMHVLRQIFGDVIIVR